MDGSTVESPREFDSQIGLTLVAILDSIEMCVLVTFQFLGCVFCRFSASKAVFLF